MSLKRIYWHTFFHLQVETLLFILKIAFHIDFDGVPLLWIWKSRGDAESSFAICDNWSGKEEYMALSSQSLWGPSVGSIYPFPRFYIWSCHPTPQTPRACYVQNTATDPGKTRCISPGPCSQRCYSLGNMFYLCRCEGGRMACLPGY